jgi:predicted DNA-binding protein
MEYVTRSHVMKIVDSVEVVTDFFLKYLEEHPELKVDIRSLDEHIYVAHHPIYVQQKIQELYMQNEHNHYELQHINTILDQAQIEQLPVVRFLDIADTVELTDGQDVFNKEMALRSYRANPGTFYYVIEKSDPSIRAKVVIFDESTYDTTLTSEQEQLLKELPENLKTKAEYYLFELIERYQKQLDDKANNIPPIVKESNVKQEVFDGWKTNAELLLSQIIPKYKYKLNQL